MNLSYETACFTTRNLSINTPNICTLLFFFKHSILLGAFTKKKDSRSHAVHGNAYR
jgi:hypothetical protein